MKNKITDKLFELAYTDSMTEVQNRNAYEECLKKLRKPNANISRITVIVIDINGLKEINDGFGHFCGDDAIKTVAKALRETIGAKADIYRIGGDEFVCLVPCSGAAMSVDLYRTLHSAFDLFNRTSEKAYNITVSTGFYLLPKDMDSTLPEMLAHADAMLYEEKQKRDKNVAKILPK